jgi:DHA1 family multidrug resistance protein-like MFS transporter
VFIDVVGMGIIIPILPFYVEHFSSSAMVITALFSVYALLSFFSAPVIGAFSDKIGRKLMLIISILSTSLGWFVFAFAPNLLWLFIGRSIDGLAAGNLPIAQAYMSDLAKDDKERSASFGLFGAVFGIAFILGPFLGGLLGSVSARFPFIFVGALALVNGIVAIWLLPETHTNPARDRKVTLNPFTPIMRALRDKKLLPNYSAWFLFGLAIAAFQGVFSLYVQRVFGYGQFFIGVIFTSIGVVVALNQMALMKHVWLKYFAEPTLELLMLFVFAVGFVLLSFGNVTLFFIGLVGTTFGQSILRGVMNSQIAAKADSSRRGEVLGITASIASLALAIGPLFAGSLFEYSHGGSFLLGAALLLVSFLVLYRNRRTLKGLDVEHTETEPTVI